MAHRIGQDITCYRKRELEKVGNKPNTKELWKAVKQLTGWERESAGDPGVTAESLNQHYASVSTDNTHDRLPLKDTAIGRFSSHYNVTDYEAFNLLDTLTPTATGLDNLPVWFLRLAAPVIYGLVADVINVSAKYSYRSPVHRTLRHCPVA